MGSSKDVWESGPADPLLRPLLERAARIDEGLSVLQYTLRRSASHRHVQLPWDHDSWAEDLERIAGYLGRQQFERADTLLIRWTHGPSPGQSGETEMWLQGRTFMLMGDAQRDRGRLTGPLSADYWYQGAHGIFQQLHAKRLAAQAELSLAVVTEMTGHVRTAADRYRALANDERLSQRDRGRARLWVGTALNKNRQHESAVHAMAESAQIFENLDEPEDWAVAHQKMGLAERSAGHLDRALQHIQIARKVASDLTPLQRVRLDTAQAHCLLTDPATRGEGLSTLRSSRELADRYGLAHQLRSIEAIHAQFA